MGVRSSDFCGFSPRRLCGSSSIIERQLYQPLNHIINNIILFERDGSFNDLTIDRSRFIPDVPAR